VGSGEFGKGVAWIQVEGLKGVVTQSCSAKANSRRGWWRNREGKGAAEDLRMVWCGGGYRTGRGDNAGSRSILQLDTRIVSPPVIISSQPSPKNAVNFFVNSICTSASVLDTNSDPSWKTIFHLYSSNKNRSILDGKLVPRSTVPVVPSSPCTCNRRRIGSNLPSYIGTLCIRRCHRRRYWCWHYHQHHVGWVVGGIFILLLALDDFVLIYCVGTSLEW